MSGPLTFEIRAECPTSQARVGRVTTPHGSFDTPAFMPVATKAAMKGLTPAQTRGTGSQIILNNAYHLMLRPGSELVRRLGGSHRFMRWDGPILTDSGGYQAYSMSDVNRIDEDGVAFKSIVDGSTVHLGPERSIEVQNDLGADIIMAFDDCPPGISPDRPSGEDGPEPEPRAAGGGRFRPTGSEDPRAHRRRLEEAVDRTARWLERCVRAHRRPEEQALFGIVQGGTNFDLRERSLGQILGVDLPGYAIGGVAVGEGSAWIRRVVEFTAPRLPRAKPRYLMGVGYEWDIVAAVRAGADMFDCVLPTRNGRNANAFTREGPIRLRNARFGDDPRPIEESCDCEACAGGFSRAYLRHLFLSKEMLGPTLTSLHNIRHFQRLMLDIRRAIRENGWSLLLERWPVVRARVDAVDAASTSEKS